MSVRQVCRSHRLPEGMMELEKELLLEGDWWKAGELLLGCRAEGEDGLMKERQKKRHRWSSAAEREVGEGEEGRGEKERRKGRGGEERKRRRGEEKRGGGGRGGERRG